MVATASPATTAASVSTLVSRTGSRSVPTSSVLTHSNTLLTLRVKRMSTKARTEPSLSLATSLLMTRMASYVAIGTYHS